MAEELKREISFRDLILFHITAIVTVRWISFAAARGPSSIGLWVLSFFFFLLPIAYVVIDFSRKMPVQGGLYQWTKHTLGPFHGFLCAWCYVVNNLFYFPSLLVAVSGYLAFGLTGNDQSLQDNKTYVIGFSLGSIWLILLLNYIGLKFGKWVENIGGLAIWIPCALLILFGALYYFRSGSSTHFTLSGMLPDLRKFPTLSAWSQICFAFTGIELASTMSGEIKNPERSLPKSIYIACASITGIYVLGTVAVMFMLSSDKINMVTGIMQAIQVILERVGVPSLTPAVAILLMLGGLGTLGAWFSGAARLPYSVGVDRYLPAALAKIHPKYGSPHVSLLVLGIISSVVVIMSLAGSSVQQAYLAMGNASLILYFIPFGYLFVSHIVLNLRSGRKPFPLLLACAGIVSTVIAIVLTFIPPADANAIIYLLEVVGGSFGFILISLVFYFRGKKQISAA